jgi:hypothetical protein
MDQPVADVTVYVTRNRHKGKTSKIPPIFEPAFPVKDSLRQHDHLDQRYVYYGSNITNFMNEYYIITDIT